MTTLSTLSYLHACDLLDAGHIEMATRWFAFVSWLDANA